MQQLLDRAVGRAEAPDRKLARDPLPAVQHRRLVQRVVGVAPVEGKGRQVELDQLELGAEVEAEFQDLRPILVVPGLGELGDGGGGHGAGFFLGEEVGVGDGLEEELQLAVEAHLLGVGDGDGRTAAAGNASRCGGLGLRCLALVALLMLLGGAGAGW